jgi:hypothetical protein
MYFFSDNDIYSINIPKGQRQLANTHVQGTVRAAGTGTPLAANVRVVNATTNQVESTFKSKDDGSYSLILGSLNPYRIEFVHDPYIMTQAEFDFRTQEGYKEVKQDIELKSDYTLKFTVKDKDLGFGLTSFLSVTDNTGKKIYNDSLRVADLPLNLKLTTLNKYTAAVQAPNYVSKNQALTFDAAAFKPDAPYTVEMEPEKIKFAADVTDVNSKQKMRTKIYYNNESREEVIVAEEGEAVYLRKGDRYQVVTSSDKGYIFSSATVVAGEGTSDGDSQSELDFDDEDGETYNLIWSRPTRRNGD